MPLGTSSIEFIVEPELVTITASALPSVTEIRLICLSLALFIWGVSTTEVYLVMPDSILAVCFITSPTSLTLVFRWLLMYSASSSVSLALSIIAFT